MCIRTPHTLPLTRICASTSAVSSSDSSACVSAIFGHRRCIQACFDRPLPPNLIISRQALHLPQSVS